MASDVQLDLFAAAKPAVQPRPAVQAPEGPGQAHAEWLARFYGLAEWTHVWGPTKGQTSPGFRCPGCGEVEPNGGRLAVSHGWDPYVPGSGPPNGQCLHGPGWSITGQQPHALAATRG